MAVNKIIYGNQTLLDLTGDTVTSSSLLSGYTAHGKDGVQITGTLEPTKYTAKITSAGDFSSREGYGRFVSYNNTRYYTQGNSFEFEAGKVLKCFALDRSFNTGTIYIDGEEYQSSNTGYSYTLPAHDINIAFDTTGNSVTITAHKAHTATIMTDGTYSSTFPYNYVIYPGSTGTAYYTAETQFEFNAGDTIYCVGKGATPALESGNFEESDGQLVIPEDEIDMVLNPSYSYTLPDYDIEIYFSSSYSGSSQGLIFIKKAINYPLTLTVWKYSLMDSSYDNYIQARCNKGFSELSEMYDMGTNIPIMINNFADIGGYSCILQFGVWGVDQNKIVVNPFISESPFPVEYSFYCNSNSTWGIHRNSDYQMSITSNGTYYPISSDGWSEVYPEINVNVPTSGGTAVSHPDPTISVNSSTGVITASHTQQSGIVTGGTTTATQSLTTQAAKTITPTKSSQTAVAAGRYTTGTVTVAAIPSQYITTTDATATASDIVSGETAYVNGSKVTGTLSVTTVYHGSNTPSSSTGSNGDIYIQS